MGRGLAHRTVDRGLLRPAVLTASADSTGFVMGDTGLETRPRTSAQVI